MRRRRDDRRPGAWCRAASDRGGAAAAVPILGVAMAFRRNLGSLRVAGWIVMATTARLLAAAGVVAAAGAPCPLALAPAVLAAVELSGMLPLTPGNVGRGRVARPLRPRHLRSRGDRRRSALPVRRHGRVGRRGRRGSRVLTRRPRGATCGYVRRKLGSSLSVLDGGRPLSALSEKLGTIVRRRPPPSPVATTVTQT